MLAKWPFFEKKIKKTAKFRHHDSCLGTKLPQGCPVSPFRPVLDTFGTFFGRFLVFLSKKTSYDSPILIARHRLSHSLDQYGGPQMGKNPRKSTPGTQIVPNIHQTPTQTPQKHRRKSSQKTHFFQKGHYGACLTSFLKKVCFSRRFSVVFLRCLGGCLVDIWHYLGSWSAFSGVFTHLWAPILVQTMGQTVSCD